MAGKVHAMHGRDHVAGGADPIPSTALAAQFFQYRSSADATISDSTSTKLFFDTQSVNTVNSDFTIAYSAGGGGVNPFVSLTTTTTASSIWVFGMRVTWSLATHAADVYANIQLNPVADDGAGNTVLTYYSQKSTDSFGSKPLHVATYAYLLNPTVGQGISLVATVFQVSGGDQTVSHSATAINGTNVWGIRVA